MENKNLFELIHNLGEGIYNSVNIVELTSTDILYRVYHSDGYCFQVEREYITDLESFIEEFGNVNIGEYYYSFDSQMFSEFKPIDVKKAIILIQECK